MILCSFFGTTLTFGLIMKTKSRIDSVDFLKGIGILLVAIGHSSFFSFIDDYSVNRYIYSYHMPLFAFIAGLFTNGKSVGVQISNKINKLLVPFLIWSFLYWLCMFSFVVINNPELIKAQIFRIIYILAGSGQNSAVNGLGNVAVWFLPFLFVISMIHLLNNKMTTRVARLAFVAGCIAIGYGFRAIGYPMPYNIDVAFTLYPFFFAGSLYFKEIKPLAIAPLLNMKYSMLYAIPIISVLVLLQNKMQLSNVSIDTASNVIGNGVVFYSAAFIAIYYTCLISEIFKSNVIVNFFGVNSLIIVIWHLPIYYVISSLLPSELKDLLSLPLTLLMCIPVVVFINKYLKSTIGEWRLIKEDSAIFLFISRLKFSKIKATKI